MPRTFYCTSPYIDPETGINLGVLGHDWTVESSPLALTHDNLFIPCPDHDPDLPNSQSLDHAYFQSPTLLPR